MITALLSFRDSAKGFSAEAEKRLVWIFGAGGISVDNIEVFSVKDATGFEKRFAELTETCDNVIILGGDDATFDVKEIIARKFGLQIEENQNAAKFVAEYSRNAGAAGFKEYALLPEGSTVIPNFKGFFQGYMTEGDAAVTVLPSDPEMFESMCERYVLPYFETKYKIRFDKLILKLFGVPEQILEKVLKKARIASDDKLRFDTERKYSDVKLSIIYDDKTPRMLTDDAIRLLVGELKEYIYAEENCSLGKRLFDLLNLHRKHISFAESFTAGRVASALISVSGASAVLNEGIIAYSNHSKQTRLGVRAQTLAEHGAVSKQTAYEMAAGLLSDAVADVAVSTTGIAGPKSDDTKKPVGLCYIAVGGREGIHIHKLNLSGDRETITETAKNTALFLAIKHLKEML